jgi:hypothetical protein
MADEQNAEDEIVNVPVPVRYLSVVYQALNEAWVEDTASSPAAPSGESLRRGWTKPEISKLKKTIKNETVRAMLDLTADRAGEWVNYADICAAVDRDWTAVRGDLAGFSQLLRRKFNKEGRDKWPVEVEWATAETPTRYRMPLNLARWWNEAKSQALPKSKRI